MNGVPEAVDLLAVRAELLKRGLHLDLCHLIRRARIIQGCAADLREAQSYLEALQASLISPRRGRIPEHKLYTQASLLSTVTMLYVRATSGGAKRGERGSSQIADALPEGLKPDHLAVVAVRQRALAHVYHDEIIDEDQWHRGTVMLVQFAAGWRPAAAGNRIQFNTKLYDRLRRLVPVATDIMVVKGAQHLDDAAARFTELARSDSKVLGIGMSAKLDLLEFYRNEENMRAALAIAENSQSGHFSSFPLRR